MEENTTYKYKAFVNTTVQGVVYASEQSAEFTTLPPLEAPAVTTVRAFYPGSGNRMQMEGYVTNTGNPWYTEKGFVIGTGTVTNPSLENNYMRTTASGNAAGTFFNTLSGLNTPNTTYYIRAYIKNSVGTSYGSTVT